MSSKTDKQPVNGHRVPWWRVRMMWLVVGGPLAVVVAGVITAVIAIRSADEVIGSGAAPQAQRPAEDTGDTRPALEARNKASAEAAAAAAAAAAASAGQR